MGTKPKRNHDLRVQLRADAIDPNLGILRACTVAKADVPALGKIVMLDRAGQITYDPEQSVRELPVYTDATFLDTLMAAASVETRKKNRLKVREDHRDDVGARAGYVELFRRVKDDQHGDRVVADVHLYAAYKNRAVVLETAAANPEELGLSIDLIPEYVIDGDRALMRVAKLIAVDIVDAGAITPGGLFLSAAEGAAVDSDEKEQAAPPANNQPPPKMPATIEDVLAALKPMVECMTNLAAKLNAPPAPPAANSATADEMKAVQASVLKLEADLKTSRAETAQLKRERQIMGLELRVPATELERLKSGSADDLEAAEKNAKTYTELVEARVKETKCKRSEAHRHVMTANPDAYRLHLKVKGVYDPAKDKNLAA